MIDITNLVVVHGNKKILNIDTLRLENEGAIALIGPNGSGKTTLIKCLTGIQKTHSSTRLLLNNKSLSQYSNKARARLMGYIPQSFNPCWNQTVTELIMLAASRTMASPQAIDETCQQFELAPLLSNHWDTLSGGEKARILAAMALIGYPSLLVADEPGAALDIKHRLRLIEQLVEYGKRQLAVICLHELDLVFRYFKKAILLSEGRVVFYGNTGDLLNDTLLDKTFGVSFKRIKQDGNYILYPEL